jgi:hypothetical protein
MAHVSCFRRRKGKSLYLIKHHIIKSLDETEVKVHVFLTSVEAGK